MAKDLNKLFSKEDIQMASRHMERCSMSLIIREMQIKTIMRYHLTLARMAIINKSTKQVLARMWRKGNPFLHCWWECRLWKAVWRHLKKLKMNLPFDAAIPLLGIHLKEPKTLIQKNISTPMFTAALFTITKIWKQPKCPSIDEWIKQLWDISTMEYYLVIKKKKILSFATVWVGVENIMLSEISQSETDKYERLYDFTDMWNLMNKLN